MAFSVKRCERGRVRTTRRGQVARSTLRRAPLAAAPPPEAQQACTAAACAAQARESAAEAAKRRCHEGARVRGPPLGVKTSVWGVRAGPDGAQDGLGVRGCVAGGAHLEHGGRADAASRGGRRSARLGSDGCAQACVARARGRGEIDGARAAHAGVGGQRARRRGGRAAHSVAAAGASQGGAARARHRLHGAERAALSGAGPRAAACVDRVAVSVSALRGGAARRRPPRWQQAIKRGARRAAGAPGARAATPAGREVQARGGSPSRASGSRPRRGATGGGRS